MSTHSDLIIPLSALKFGSEGTAYADVTAGDVTQIGVLLQTVIKQHAASTSPDQSVHFVSVTYDVSAEAAPATEVQFESRIDRRTRTLIFASGFAKQNDRHLLKATVVFRIE